MNHEVLPWNHNKNPQQFEEESDPVESTEYIY